MAKQTEEQKAEAAKKLRANLEELPEEEKRDFLAFLEARGHRNWDPLSKEGLELQAMYVQECSTHPLDVLSRLMMNPYCTPSERINATKVLMEYSMRKVPNNIELSTTTQALKVDASALQNLSLTELETLQALLAKAQTPST